MITAAACAGRPLCMGRMCGLGGTASTGAALLPTGGAVEAVSEGVVERAPVKIRTSTVAYLSPASN
jgi:hypothetical protein